MGSNTFIPTEAEKKALKELIRNGFDLAIDFRHWQCLSKLARRTRRTVPDVLNGLLEKVFVADLKMITPLDDTMDRPLTSIRTKIERFRLQPQKLEALLRERKDELLLLADVFPEEMDPEMDDIVSRLRANYIAPTPGAMKEKRLMLPDAKIEELTKKLAFKRRKPK